MSYSVRFDDSNQEVIFRGVMRPRAAEELNAVREAIMQAISRVNGTLLLNFKRLNKLNNVAFHELAGILGQVCKLQPDLKIRIIISSVAGWATRKFKVIDAISPNIFVEQYDHAFYPGQGVVEDEGFIPLLRAQTKLTWRHERELLQRHGLERGMRVADICCGIGDFAVLVQKEFEPAHLLALDHARSSLDYARKMAAHEGVREIEYVCGDASALLLEDNQFDFVTCRHALQVFNEPELIVKELFRICKPGGRVYITNEQKSHCVVEPKSETIAWTYRELAKLFAHFEMDMESGPKGRDLLQEGGFEDIQMESFTATNRDGDPQDFADVIRAWEDVYAGEMAVERGDSPEWIAQLRQGFQDHIAVALDPSGYAGWPNWVTSGRKPA